MKVMVVIGTRPELIKLCMVLKYLDSLVDLCIVHTCQNFDFELHEAFYDDLGIRRPDYFVEADNRSGFATFLACSAKEIDRLIMKERPDSFVIYGDTNSCLTSIIAKKRRIPIIHLEAGNRCYDERVPEEVNRRIIDGLSDINVVLTENARLNLLREGMGGDRVLCCGSLMGEILSSYRERIENSSVAQKYGLDDDDYIVISLHREENVDSRESVEKIGRVLQSVRSEFKKRMIFSLHPRARRRFEELQPSLREGIDFVKPLNFTDYVSLQNNAFCAISDSGTLSEEAGILGFPAVTIRNATERQEGKENAYIVQIGLDEAEHDIVPAVKLARMGIDGRQKIEEYKSVSGAKAVVGIILCETRKIRERVWMGCKADYA